jgi:hypothetical protein
MKKVTRVLSIALLSSLFAAAACKGKSGTDKNNPKPVEPQTTGEPANAPGTAPAANTPNAPAANAPAANAPAANQPAANAPAANAPANPAGAPGATGIAECDAYSAAFEKYMQCDKVPQATKDASKATMDHMKEGWAALSGQTTPEAAKKAAADGCKTAMDSLEQSASALGCAIK